MKYIIFTQSGCCRCPALKNFLASSGVPGEELDAKKNFGRCVELSVSSTPTAIFYDFGDVEVGRAYDITSARKIIEAHK